MTSPSPVPTQTRHPWRATVRTIVAAGLGLLSLLPTIALTTHLDTAPAVAQVLAIAGAITRVLALPGVDQWLRDYLPGLAAEPARPTVPPAPPTDTAKW